MIGKRKVGIVLSGGGAKGFAHIGVLKVLEENGISPDVVVGTSMGSVLGGLYAYGMSPIEMQHEALKFKTINMFDLNLFNITKQGLIAGNKFVKFIDKYAKGAMIENLKKQFACTACDVRTGKRYTFDSGKLSLAVKTSSAIPGLIAPLRKDGMLLVDGGVVDNIPTDIAYTMGAEYVISVDCIGDAYLKSNVKNTADILFNSFSIAQYNLTKERGYRTDAKIIINNYKNWFMDMRQETTKKNIQIGVDVMKEHIKKIKNDLKIE